MADRLTSIHLPGSSVSGRSDWGRCTPEHMIALLRADARRALKDAQNVLDASDEDFRVETYVGVHVRRNLTVLQEGRPRG